MAAAVNKRTTESKYVSVFADSRPDVDVTFRDVLLQRPTNHYLVGVDSMSLCSSQMSMIEPLTGDQEALIRIRRKVAPVAGVAVTLETLRGDDGGVILQGMDIPIGAALHAHGTALTALDAGLANYTTSILTSEIITTVQQLMHRLNEVAGSINQLMHTPGAMAPVFPGGGQLPTTFGYVPVPDAEDEKELVHLSFSLGHDGRISISGTKAFWSVFVIEIPAIQYQHGFYGTLKDEGSLLRRYLVVDPQAGLVNFDTMVVDRFGQDLNARTLAVAEAQFYLDADNGADGGVTAALQAAVAAATALLQAATQQNPYAINATGATARVLVQQRGQSQSHYDSGDGNAQVARMTGVNAVAQETITIRLQANTFSTLDRRVAIEMGCSLPIKNSPMVDHQKETPDFVLARWIYQPDTRVDTAPTGTSTRYSTALTNSVTYQKSADRIVYHELMPQQKIQTLRLMLFARIRAFDELSERWSMRVIELPTNNTDWWHVRLHFVSKD